MNVTLRCSGESCLSLLLEVLLTCCEVQWSSALLVLSGDVGTSGQKSRDDVLVPPCAAQPVSCWSSA